MHHYHMMRNRNTNIFQRNLWFFVQYQVEACNESDVFIGCFQFPILYAFSEKEWRSKFGHILAFDSLFEFVEIEMSYI